MGALLLPRFTHHLFDLINRVPEQFSFRPSSQFRLVGGGSGCVGETLRGPWYSFAQGNRFVAQFGNRRIVCRGKSSASLLANVGREVGRECW